MTDEKMTDENSRIAETISLSQGQMTVYKYEKHFPKMYRDVGMAVLKTTQTRYMDGSVQATQMTTQVTPSLHHFSFLLAVSSTLTTKLRYKFYLKK